MPKSDFERGILFAALRNTIPSIRNYDDELMASKIKNVDLVAREFVILVNAELTQKYNGAPQNNQNLLIQCGTSGLRYIKETIEGWRWKVTVKTLCENIDLLQNKFADECPAMAEYKIKLDYRTAFLA